MKKLSRNELRALEAAKRSTDSGGGWLPWRGMFFIADCHLKNGLFIQCGISVMPPHKLYMLTDKGRAELAARDGAK